MRAVAAMQHMGLISTTQGYSRGKNVLGSENNQPRKARKSSTWRFIVTCEREKVGWVGDHAIQERGCLTHQLRDVFRWILRLRKRQKSDDVLANYHQTTK